MKVKYNLTTLFYIGLVLIVEYIMLYSLFKMPIVVEFKLTP